MHKITIVCTSPGFGGLEMNTLRLAASLQEYGWQVELLVRRGSRLHEAATGAAIHTRDMSRGGLPVLRALLSARPDVAFTSYNKDIAVLARYKGLFRRRVKLVYQQHMMLGISKRDLIHALRYQMLDCWISPLHTLKAEVLEKTRVAASQVAVVPFGLRTPEPVPLSREDARLQLGLPQDAFLIGILGRIDPKKGQAFLVRALKRLRKTGHPGIHLLITGEPTPGEGPAHREHLDALVRDLGLEGAVHFRPFLREPRMFYAAIDLFAMASDAESFGMVTLEALLNERPVLGTASGGTPELLDHGRLGGLFAPGDEEDFCRQVLDRCVAAPDGAALAEARETVARTYDSSAINSRINHLLREVAGR